MLDVCDGGIYVAIAILSPIFDIPLNITSIQIIVPTSDRKWPKLRAVVVGVGGLADKIVSPRHLVCVRRAE